MVVFIVSRQCEGVEDVENCVEEKEWHNRQDQISAYLNEGEVSGRLHHKDGSSSFSLRWYALQTDVMSRTAGDFTFGEHRRMHEQDYFFSGEADRLPCIGHLGGASLDLLSCIRL